MEHKSKTMSSNSASFGARHDVIPHERQIQHRISCIGEDLDLILPLVHRPAFQLCE
jgi:hypothetical protein